MTVWQLLLIAWIASGLAVGIWGRKIQRDAAALGKAANIALGLAGALLGGFVSLVVLGKSLGIDSGVVEESSIWMVMGGAVIGGVAVAVAFVWIAGKAKARKASDQPR
jgi:uncharacterized membrane protein YeaQ/YmgE (transglycosylase-associated protein family)